MYDDDDLEVFVPHQRTGPYTSAGPTAYCPARFPTKNISSPIVLFYGDSDSLVDIDLMLKELPENSTPIPLEVSVLYSLPRAEARRITFHRVMSIWMCSGGKMLTRTSFLKSSRL